MKKISLVLAVALIVLMSGLAHAAGFANGGFENGTFSGWTLVDTEAGDSAIVTTGTDLNTDSLLQTVSGGSYGARVGNQAGGNHSSTLYQTVTNWTDAAIYFAWAAVLQEPTNGINHSVAEMPDFSVQLLDLTDGTTLYDKTYNTTNLPAGFFTGATNSVAGDVGKWHYNQWVAETLPTGADVQGDTLKLIITATDCGLGGHGGYVYVDQVGSTPPNIPSVPEPVTMLLLGFGLVGVAGLRRRFTK